MIFTIFGGQAGSAAWAFKAGAARASASAAIARDFIGPERVWSRVAMRKRHCAPHPKSDTGAQCRPDLIRIGCAVEMSRKAVLKTAASRAGREGGRMGLLILIAGLALFLGVHTLTHVAWSARHRHRAARRGRLQDSLHAGFVRRARADRVGLQHLSRHRVDQCLASAGRHAAPHAGAACCPRSSSL